MLQDEDHAQETTTFVPSFEAICDFFHRIVDTMVASVWKLPRLEHQLFQAVEDMESTYISTLQLDPEVVREEILDICKGRIRKVIMANSHGPTK